MNEKFLVDEVPLFVLPSLAKKFGLEDAIILQQMHFWLRRSPKESDGRRWLKMSYDDWRRELNECVSFSTVRRIFANLEKAGVVISRPSGTSDRKKFWTIDYQKLSELRSAETGRETTPPAQNEQTPLPVLSTVTAQNGRISIESTKEEETKPVAVRSSPSVDLEQIIYDRIGWRRRLSRFDMDKIIALRVRCQNAGRLSLFFESLDLLHSGLSNVPKYLDTIISEKLNGKRTEQNDRSRDASSTTRRSLGRETFTLETIRRAAGEDSAGNEASDR